MAVRKKIASVTDHGGSLDAARSLFPNAPQPWIDLSTGINPHAYPQPILPADAFTRLPEPGKNAELCRVAGENYGAPSAANVVAAPGTQILLPRVASLIAPGKAGVLGPTYAEHSRAAAIAGHDAAYVRDFDALYDVQLAIVVNPNNPDGRIIERGRLVDLAQHLARKGGLLVVDEAFMDVGPLHESVSADVEGCGAVVLKSFGKFFGLAGVRLGFALAPVRLAEFLGAELGPWAVAGPAVEFGLSGLADRSWQASMRRCLEREAAALDDLLVQNGITVEGGTSLFRFVRTPQAPSLFESLGGAGVLVRRFVDLPDALRIGLPAGKRESERLAGALNGWRPGQQSSCQTGLEPVGSGGRIVS
ncbi:threonine-phosphate decarboxylase CobD [Arvimicrobium flavum]|uniref:threonine-phosphate decarboxylase CobD n=1 Tax=Arvimicrobium flavum TaxID=3393320 RepID=UPI00237C36DE|nr:threonine-phosphate decarboxylase CobD [Mesorhizobium shangrilense]